jgi:hypothetical protein
VEVDKLAGRESLITRDSTSYMVVIFEIVEILICRSGDGGEDVGKWGEEMK